MMKQKNDRRTVRTKKAIKEALSELIEEKGFNNITVTDITTKADINRCTFYIHYMDKFDLLEKVENEVMQEIAEKVQEIHHFDISQSFDVSEPVPYIAKLFEYFSENADFMKAILGSKGDPLFYKKLKDFIETNLLQKKLLKDFLPEKLLFPEEYVISYIISAHLGVVQQWLENGMDKSPKEMADILSKMSLFGPLRISGLNS